MKLKFLFMALPLCSLLANVQAADLSGDWEFAGTSLGKTKYARIHFKMEGES